MLESAWLTNKTFVANLYYLTYVLNNSLAGKLSLLNLLAGKFLVLSNVY